MTGIKRTPIALALAALCTTGYAQQTERSLGEVRVTSNQDADRERQASSIPMIVIHEEELERYSDATVGDVLRRLPGMTFTGPPGVVKDIRMRGVDKGYTNFLIDGEPIATGKKERQIQVDRLPADMIERIEIIRSPSAEYDSNGIGGTVNIVLKQSAREDATRLRASLGKNGSLDVGDTILQLHRRFDAVDISLLGSWTVGAEDVEEVKDKFNAAGAFTEREVKGRPVKKDELLLAPRIRWRLGADTDLVIEPTLSRGSERKTEPSTFTNAAGVVTKRAVKIENKTDKIERLGARLTRRMSDTWSWTVKAGVERGEEDKGVPEAREYNAAGVLTKTTFAPETTREQRGYAGASAAIRIGANHQIRAGAEVAATDYDNLKRTIENGVDRTAGRDNFAIDERRLTLFALDEWRLAKQHWLTPGLRLEHFERTSIDSSGARQDSTANAPNPSVHYRWALRPDVNLRASAARTVRMPKFDDVNPLVALAGGANTAINADSGGNAALKPETSTGLDAGIEAFTAGGGVFGANIYDRSVEDFIQKVTALEGARFVARPQNVGSARFRGIEFDGRQPVPIAGGKLTVSGNLSLLSGQVHNPLNGANGDVKDLPPWVANLGVDYTLGRWAFGASASYQPGFTTDAVNVDNGLREVKIKNRQTLLDVYALWKLAPGAELRLVGKNLLRINKLEDTIRYNANGTLNGREFRSETSEPTVFLTFEYRY